MKSFFSILLYALLYATMLQFSVEDVIYMDDIVNYEDTLTDNLTVQEIITDCHNEMRRNVDPPAANMLKLYWSTELEQAAREWSKLCYLNHSEPSDRNMNGYPCGENILSSPVPISWKKAINVWYEERKYLKFGEGTIAGEVVGHYTQIVADNTFCLGCALTKCYIAEISEFFYVCRYYTAGNYPHSLYKPYNRGSPCSQCKSHCDDNNLCLNYCDVQDDVSNCKDVKAEGLCNCKELYEVCKATCGCRNKIY